MRMIVSFTVAVVLMVGSLTQVKAQGSFEGYIEFRKTNLAQSTYYRYSVKGNKVRVDELDTDQSTIVATLLVDLDKKEMLALSHDRNLYMTREYKPYEAKDPDMKEIKSDNHKMILGKDCEQWRVRNEAKKSDITYWVTPGNFKFFPQLLDVMGRKDNFATFYQHLSGIEGVFPMLAVEYDMVRNVKGKLEVVDIQEKEMEDELFILPKSYLEVHN